MKVKCVKCGRTYDIPVITQIVNVCDQCKNVDVPDFIQEIFGGM